MAYWEAAREVGRNVAMFGAGLLLPTAVATIATALVGRIEPYEAGIIGRVLSHIIPTQILHSDLPPFPLVYSRDFISCQGLNVEACMGKFAPAIEEQTIGQILWSTLSSRNSTSDYLLPESSPVHIFNLLLLIFGFFQNIYGVICLKLYQAGVQNFTDLLEILIFYLILPVSLIYFSNEIYHYCERLDDDVQAFCHKHFDDPVLEGSADDQSQHQHILDTGGLFEMEDYPEVDQASIDQALASEQAIGSAQVLGTSRHNIDCSFIWDDAFGKFVRRQIATMSRMLDEMEHKCRLEAEEKVSETIQRLKKEMDQSQKAMAAASTAINLAFARRKLVDDQFSAAKVDLDHVKSELINAESKTQRLNTTIVDMTNEMNGHKTAQAQLQTTITSLEKQITEFKSENEGLVHEKQSRLDAETELGILKTPHQQSLTSVHELEQKVLQLKTDSDSTNGEQTKIAGTEQGLREYIEELEAVLKREDAAKVAAQKELADYKKQAFDNSIRLGKRIETLADENKVLKGHKCPPSDTWKVMGDLKADKVRLEEELAQCKEEAASLLTENASLKEQIEAKTPSDQIVTAKGVGGDNNTDKCSGADGTNPKDDDGDLYDGDLYDGDDGSSGGTNNIASDGSAGGDDEKATPRDEYKSDGANDVDATKADGQDDEQEWESDTDGEVKAFGMLGDYKVTGAKPSAQDQGKGKASEAKPQVKPASFPAPDDQGQKAAAIAAAKAKHIRDSYPESAGPKTDNEKISESIFDALDALPKKGLDQSIWAPGNEHLRPGAAKGPSIPSRSSSAQAIAAEGPTPASSAKRTGSSAGPAKNASPAKLGDKPMATGLAGSPSPAKPDNKPFDGIPTGPRTPGKPPKARQWGPPPTNDNLKASLQPGSSLTNHPALVAANEGLEGTFGPGSRQGLGQGQGQRPRPEAVNGRGRGGFGQGRGANNSGGYGTRPGQGAGAPNGGGRGLWQGQGPYQGPNNPGRAPNNGGAQGPVRGQGAGPGTNNSGRNSKPPPQGQPSVKTAANDSFKRVQELLEAQRKKKDEEEKK